METATADPLFRWRGPRGGAPPRPPISAFFDLPRIAAPPPEFRRDCRACGTPSYSGGCDRCSRRSTREDFIARWEGRGLPRGDILDALLIELGWENRNYDLADEREAFMAALEANAEPEVFRDILREAGLEGIVDSRDAKRVTDRESWLAQHSAWAASRANRRAVPALILTPDEARIHARALLAERPRYPGAWRLNTGLTWAYQDEIYLQVLCIGGADIDRASAALGRSPSSIAWRARDAGMTLPKAWRPLVASKAPRKPAEPKWVPMAYPYVSAKRAENAHVLEVNSLVARYLPGRADICQEILLALWEKRVTMDDLRKQGTQLRSFVKQFYKSNHELGGYARSLDAPLMAGSEFSLMDTI